MPTSTVGIINCWYEHAQSRHPHRRSCRSRRHRRRVLTLLLYEKQDYRDCVAQMWDRKHPAEVRQRQSDADFRECEAYRLREGANCDCKVAFGQPKFCSTHSRIERQVLGAKRELGDDD